MEGVTVITCTIRQEQMNHIFENYSRQSYEPKQLIIILNRDDLNIQKWRERAEQYDDILVFRQSQNKSLGGCLNFGVSKARHSVIAKFDDDDYYGPGYLNQAIQALQTTEAAVVGKDAHTTYFENDHILAVFRPYNQNVYTNHIGGGTIVFKKSVFSHVKFPLTNLAEDIIFLNKCLDKGIKIFSTDKNHYCYIRRKDKQTHTWQVEDEEMLWECEIVEHTEDYQPYVDPT